MKERHLFLNTLLLSLIILILIYTSYIFLIIFLLPYITYYLLKYGTHAKALFLTLFFALLFNYHPANEISDSYFHEAVVDNVYTSSITVIEDGQKYYLMGIDEQLSHGDVIKYTSIYNDDVEKGSFDLFYKSTKAVGYGWANNIEVVAKVDNLRGDIHNDLYLNEGWYSDFTLLMLYGEESGFGEMINNGVTKMGISHLFVVSGFHIALFYVFIEKILSNILKSSKMANLAAFTISTGFLYLVYFPPTGIRALLTLIFIRGFNLERTESLSLTGMLFFIINPWMLLTNSMILSFSITFSIYLYRPQEVSIIDMLTLSMFAFYISLPTISTWETQHNLTAPLLSIVLTPIVAFMYIISLVVLPFRDCWHLFDPVFGLFFWILNTFSNVSIYFDTGLLSIPEQLYITALSIYYIHLLKNNRGVLLTSFFSISLFVFLI